MSSNTPAQKACHKAHQAFRDKLKELREVGYCDWPYHGHTYRVVAGDELRQATDWERFPTPPTASTSWCVLPDDSV